MPLPLPTHQQMLDAQAQFGPFDNVIMEQSARIAELEAALRPLAALVNRPWHGCATALQSVNRDDAERAAKLLTK